MGEKENGGGKYTSNTTQSVTVMRLKTGAIYHSTS